MRVLITGSSKGLGAELARVFARDSRNKVFLHGRSEADLKALSAELRSDYITQDLAEVNKAESVFEFARRSEADVLINNAGIYQAQNESTADMIRLIDTNLTAGIILLQKFYDYRKQVGGGTIVNINSLAGIYPNANEATYCASKFGLTGFVQSLQEKCSFDNIRVYEYFFGGITTQMTAHRADHSLLIDPREAAELIYHNLVSFTSLCSMSQKVKRLKYKA
jgi:short-subunit dehydrogenase